MSTWVEFEASLETNSVKRPGCVTKDLGDILNKVAIYQILYASCYLDKAPSLSSVCMFFIHSRAGLDLFFS